MGNRRPSPATPISPLAELRCGAYADAHTRTSTCTHARLGRPAMSMLPLPTMPTKYCSHTVCFVLRVRSQCYPLRAPYYGAHVEYFPGRSRQEPRLYRLSDLVGETGGRGQEKEGNTSPPSIAVQAYARVRTTHTSSRSIQLSGSCVCVTAARRGGCSSNFTPPPQSKKARLIAAPQTSITGSKLPSAPKPPKYYYLCKPRSSGSP